MSQNDSELLALLKRINLLNLYLSFSYYFGETGDIVLNKVTSSDWSQLFLELGRLLDEEDLRIENLIPNNIIVPKYENDQTIDQMNDWIRRLKTAKLNSKVQIQNPLSSADELLVKYHLILIVGMEKLVDFVKSTNNSRCENLEVNLKEIIARYQSHTLTVENPNSFYKRNELILSEIFCEWN